MSTLSDYQKALLVTLEFEGGLADIKNDPGGLTNFGITQATYDRYRDIVTLPRQSVRLISQHEIKDIYYKFYWLASGCDKLSGALAMCVFDCAVHSGPGKAIKLLQEVVGSPADGKLGPATLQAIAEEDPLELLTNYIDVRHQFLLKLSAPGRPLQHVRKGWTNRINKLRKIALEVLKNG